MTRLIQQAKTMPYSCGRLHLQGVLFRDDRSCFHAYIPAVGLAGYGRDRQEAKRSLLVVLRFYFERFMRWQRPVEDPRSVECCKDPPVICQPVFCQADMQDVLDCIRSGTGIYNISCTVDLPQIVGERR